MALPRVNEVLKFSLTIPSTGQTVRYRPYLVKEEKVLLQAFESRDMDACLQAMCDTIDACVESDVKVGDLPTFDLEYMFVKIRAKSVGETSDILIKCAECEGNNNYTVDLDKVVVEIPEVDNIIDITEDIKVEMKYPSYDKFIEFGTSENDMDTALNVVAASIVAVHTEDERIDAASQPKEEVEAFINSMTATQLKAVSAFVETMPSVKHDVRFKCAGCEAENKIELKGLSDFF